MTRPNRTAPCGPQEARSRWAAARAYLDVAELVLDEPEQDEYSSVATGLAVLAGIAASDAICCQRLRGRHRGDDHRGAADLLRTATPDGDRLAQMLRRLLDLKDAAHYGVIPVAPGRASDAVKWARKLVERAQQEQER